MKILVTGGGGQLAYACSQVFSGCEVLNVEELDITKEVQITEKLSSDYAVIINTAAVTRPDDAEKNPELAFRVNALGPLMLAKHVEEQGAILVHISTDYVFDGVRGNYTEFDTKNPKNVYGLSKSAGEDAVRAYAFKHYIIRTSALFGPRQGGEDDNFVSRLIARLANPTPVTMVHDQYTSPTYTLDLARAIQDLLAMHAPYGTYHIVNAEGGITWCAFAEEVANQTALTTTIQGVSTTETPPGPYRPRNSVLSTQALQELGIIMPSWKDALRRYTRKETL